MWQAEQRREMHAGCGGWETIEGCRPHGKSRCRQENHIRTYLKRVIGKCGLDSSCSGQPPVAGSYENGNEPSGFIKGEEYVKWLRNYQVLKDSVLCSQLVRWCASQLMCCTARQLVEKANYDSNKAFGNFSFSELAYNFPLLCPYVVLNVTHNNNIRTRRKICMSQNVKTFAALRQVKTMGWRRLLELGVGRRGQIWVAGDSGADEGHGQTKDALDKSILILAHKVNSS